MADIKRRWKPYIEEQYNRNEKPADVGTEKKDEIAKDDEGPTILTCEIDEAIKKLGKRKAEGLDGIPADFIQKVYGEMKKFVELCKNVYDEEKWPEDFLKSRHFDSIGKEECG